MKYFTYILFLSLFLFSCQQSSELVNKPCKLPIGNSKKAALTSSFYDDVPEEFSGLKDSIFKYEEQYALDPQIAFDSIVELTLEKVIALQNNTGAQKVNLLKSKAFQLYSTVSSYQLELDETILRLNNAWELIKPVDSYQDSIEMARITNLLGVAFEAKGNYPQSKHFHKLSYRLNSAMKQINDIVVDLANLGVAFQIGNQPDSSVFFLERATCIMNDNKSAIRLTLSDSLAIYYSLGKAYQELGDKLTDEGNLEKANQYYQKSITQGRIVLQKIMNAPDDFGVYPYFAAASNLATTFLKYNQADSSLHYFNISRIPLEQYYATEMNYPKDLMQLVLIRTAAALALKGKCAEARDTFEKAKLLAPSLKYMMELDYLKGKTFSYCNTQLTQQDDSLEYQLKHYNKAITYLEEILNTPGLENVVASIKKRYQFHFDKAIAVAFQIYEKNKTEKGFNEVIQLMDRSQSFNLKQRIYQKLDENNLSKVEQFLYRQEQKLRQKLKEQPNNVVFQIAFKNFITELKNSNNTEKYNYYLSRFNKTDYGLFEIRQEILNDTTALIQYHLMSNGGYISVITNQQEKIFSIKADEDLAVFCTKYYKSLNPELPKNSFFRETAYPLYNKVFRQADNWLQQHGKGIKNLMIIRDGMLQKIPFEGLLSKPHHGKDYKDLDYLMNQYNIVYHYSVSSMIGLKKLKILSANKPEIDFLLLDATTIKVANNQQKNNPPLPALNEVGRKLQKMMEKRNISNRFMEKAQRKDFFNWVNRVAVLQLNMHAYLDNNNSLNSYLQFYDAEDKSKNQQLNIKEINEIKLDNLKLAVLSNCNSIDGMSLEGDELISLVRAFTYAGCPAIIGATHSIEDKSTAAILIEFYKNLLSGQAKGEALTNAKKNFLQINSDAHPQFWLNLVCLGDNSPIEWNQQVKS